MTHSSETAIHTQTKLHYIQESGNINNYRCKNLSSYCLLKKLRGLSPGANYTTERPPLVRGVSVNFCGWRVPRGHRDRSLRPYSRISRPEPLLFLASSSSIVPPFQTRYFSENLVAQESKPDLWICSRELWPLNHRGSPSDPAMY
jgi:hypothetical protein